jgi:PPOX class probable F420-dependent enzyme
VTFALVEGVVWSAVDAKPKRVVPARVARVRRLRRDPRAALTVDRYDEDWTRLAWVQLLGHVTVYDTPELAGTPGAGAIARLCAKYRAYRELPPDGPLLALAPQRALAWSADAREQSST